MATLWLGLALWLFMALGEARLLRQARMAMLAWAALFSLPTAYRQSGRMLDTVAEEILDFAVGVLAGGQCHVLARPYITPSILLSESFLRICTKGRCEILAQAWKLGLIKEILPFKDNLESNLIDCPVRNFHRHDGCEC